MRNAVVLFRPVRAALVLCNIAPNMSLLESAIEEVRLKIEGSVSGLPVRKRDTKPDSSFCSPEIFNAA